MLFRSKTLENSSPSLFADAASAFQKISTNVYSSLQVSAVISATKEGTEELITKDTTTNYTEWIKSDAFTARIFEHFLNHLDPH